MDLVQTVRKEGSRGGAGDFKWSDVQASSHREHYLGHSVMAPTGRWAKGKDLSWYARGNGKDGEDEAATSEADARKAEIKRIKEAEQDAMARALGLPVPDRSNPNNEELGKRKDVESVLKGAAGDDTVESKGIGYSGEPLGSGRGGDGTEDFERIEGNAEQQDKELRYALNEYQRRRKHDRPSRSPSGSPRKEKHHRRRRSRDREHRRRSRSRDRDRERRRRSSPGREESHRHGHRRRYRSRSPSREDRHRHRGDGHNSRQERRDK